MKNSIFVRIIPFIFFISGAAGLIFEVVWLYRCGLVFGNSTWVASVVLSSFMGGLASGSALVGWNGWRIRDFIRVYAALEIIVGVSGVALTYALDGLVVHVAPAMRVLGSSQWLVNAVRFVTAFGLMLLPAAAMGATLPVLVGALCRWRQEFGTSLGRLYGWNTLGAVVGVLAAELFLIERFGITGTAWVAASLNWVAAAAAFYRAPIAEISHQPSVHSVNRLATWPPPGAWRLLLCAFLAGATLMALEVVWFRFLSMFAVASTLTISLMLAVVLAAIGIGGLVASARVKRRRKASHDLSVVAFVAALTPAASYLIFGSVTAGPWAAEWYRILWFAFVLTFPTALLSGVLLTITGAAREGDDALVDASWAGWFMLANTAGAMLGPLIAAFILLPRLGMERSLFALSGAYLLVGALAIRTSPMGRVSAAVRVSMAALAAIIGFVAFPFGLMSRTYLPRSVAEYAADGSRIIATREGPSETVVLMQTDWLGAPLYHRLVTNGFSMSGTNLIGKRYMRYFVYWPMLLHEAPLKRVLVACYGVGTTTAAAASLETVDSIDVVEVSPDVVAMSDLIYAPSDHPLHDPRVRLHVEDARYFLQSTADRFDLITGEPPPPLTPGTVSLYTREYFRLVRDRLAEGGMATYWLPVARRGEYDVKAIVAAFCDAFDDCSLWNGTVFDWMLVGSRHANGPAAETRFTNAWNDPRVWPRLREIGFEAPEQVGATFLGDAEYLGRLTAGTPPVTDDYPQRLRPSPSMLTAADTQRDVGSAPTAFIQDVTDPTRARGAFGRSSLIQHLWPQPLATRTLPFFDLQVVANRLMGEGASPLGRIEELHALLTETSVRRLPLWALSSDDRQQQIVETTADGSGMREYALGVRSLVARNYPGAATYFAASQLKGLRERTLGPLMVYALCLAGDLDRARQSARIMNGQTADERHFWTWMRRQFGVSASVDTPSEQSSVYR